MFHEMYGWLEKYPKLQDAVRRHESSGYYVVNILMHTSNPQLAENNIAGININVMYIEVEMGRLMGDQVKIIFSKGGINSLSVNEVTPSRERMHPQIYLTEHHIHEKLFKRQLMGGYDREDVDQFLDMVQRDYMIFGMYF